MAKTNRVKFHHKDDKQFSEIDDRGGWPVKATFLVLIHSCGSKECYFSYAKVVHDDGWNTKHASADDYYWWKISQSRKDSEWLNRLRNYLYKLIPKG